MNKIFYTVFCTAFFLIFQINLSRAFESPLKFTFEPKDKMVMLERVKAVNEEIINGVVIQKQESFVSTKVLYNKINAGFALKAEITKINFIIDGQKTQNPVFEALMECPVIYEIDYLGRFSDLKGYDKFKDILYKNFTKEFADEISKIFAEKEMKEKARFDWNQKTGNYAGKKVSNNEKWKSKEQITLPGGNKTDVDIETVFFLNEKFEGKDCIKIEIFYKNSNKGENNLKGKTFIFMNPLNMNIYSISSDRTFIVKTDKGENTLREKREYNYEYIF